jgi:ankyrin repeat protein
MTAIRQQPLLLAAGQGKETIAKLSIDGVKADLEMKAKEGWAPLPLASQRRQKAVVKMLLKIERFDLDAKGGQYHRTSLALTAKNGHEAVVRALLETGKVDMSAKDKYVWKSLSLAAQNGHDAVVKLLLETGKVEVDAISGYYHESPFSVTSENSREIVA